MPWAFPSVQSPVVDVKTGVITPPWRQYLQAFWDGTAARGEALSVQVVGGSPWTFQALRAGNFVISGGTVSSIAMDRKGTVISLGLTQGIIPVQQGDGVIVTYTILPNATFIPD